MIHTLPDPQSAASWCAQQRARGRRIGYVPTMGALHRGHLSLVERAVRENDIACASLFVNPLQFDNRDDLRNYPRDEQRDLALLTDAGCAMAYTGTLAQFFPEVDNADEIEPSDTDPDPGPAAHGLEGAFRPNHLQGVCAIVERLFRTVGDCNAYFGEKDFQQTLVVEHLARSFSGIEIVVCPTVREPSGLAMSSRNRRLSRPQQVVAAQLYQSLLAARAAWRDGQRDAAEIEWIMRECLRDERIRVEYAAVRDPENWTANTPDGRLRRARALLAAYIGEIRLIDNLSLDRD